MPTTMPTWSEPCCPLHPLVVRPQSSGQVGIVVGIELVVLGAWFLVRDYVPINWDLLWPIAVIGLGAILIAGAVRRGR